MMARANEQVAKELGAILVDGRVLSLDEARRAAAVVRASDGPRSALERASELASEARSRLDKLPDEPAVRTLISLTEYVVSRKT
jgi:geranylgeranyl pyrophosphate synthase